MGWVSNLLHERRIYAAIEDARVQMSWEVPEIARRMGVARETYDSWAEGEPVPASAVLALATELGVDVADFTRGKVQLRETANPFPKRYAEGAFSRRRTALHLLSWSDEELGPVRTDQLLGRLGATRRHFSDPDAWISLRFLEDACEELVRSGVPATALMTAGFHSSVVNRFSPIAEELRAFRQVRDAYDLQINERMEIYERNHTYRTSKLRDDFCIIESRPRAEVMEARGEHRLGSEHTCRTRIGVASGIAVLAGFPPARVHQTHCVHQGDSACRFHVDYDYAASSRVSGAGAPRIRRLDQ
jgi:transcriptional regulator with XRE-family HTH domain